MADEDLCRCGHPRGAHEHYRRGSDCGVCGSAICAGFSATDGEQSGSQSRPLNPPYDPAVGA
jgi:hypothetical protein